jgi:YD repeat-containing protein
MDNLAGHYRYEIRRRDATTAVEEAQLEASLITAVRRESDGRTFLEAAATLDQENKLIAIRLRYESALFKRDAHYRADGETFRGSISVVAGRSEIVIKLGRFGEVEVGGMTAFRTLILAHARSRGQTRWTGRVAVIDPGSLAAVSMKATCRLDRSGQRWLYEARMGETEEIELDDRGRIIRRRDSDGNETRLVEFNPRG